MKYFDQNYFMYSIKSLSYFSFYYLMQNMISIHMIQILYYTLVYYHILKESIKFFSPP
jgi:hypothetical protein